MRTSTWFLTCCVALAPACGSSTNEDFHFVPGSVGQNDSAAYELRDVGPLTLDFPRTVAATAYVPALRVESFGQTQISLKLTGSDLVYVVVGPATDVNAAPNQSHRDRARRRERDDAIYVARCRRVSRDRGATRDAHRDGASAKFQRDGGSRVSRVMQSRRSATRAISRRRTK